MTVTEKLVPHRKCYQLSKLEIKNEPMEKIPQSGVCSEVGNKLGLSWAKLKLSLVRVVYEV